MFPFCSLGSGEIRAYAFQRQTWLEFVCSYWRERQTCEKNLFYNMRPHLHRRIIGGEHPHSHDMAARYNSGYPGIYFGIAWEGSQYKTIR